MINLSHLNAPVRSHLDSIRAQAQRRQLTLNTRAFVRRCVRTGSQCAKPRCPSFEVIGRPDASGSSSRLCTETGLAAKMSGLPPGFVDSLTCPGSGYPKWFEFLALAERLSDMPRPYPPEFRARAVALVQPNKQSSLDSSPQMTIGGCGSAGDREAQSRLLLPARVPGLYSQVPPLGARLLPGAGGLGHVYSPGSGTITSRTLSHCSTHLLQPRIT